MIASFLGARALGHLACTALRFRAVLSTCVSTSALKALDEVIVAHDNVGGHVLLPLWFLREQRHGLGTSEGICTPLHTHTSAEAFRTRSLSPSLSRSFCLTHNCTHTRPTHRHGDILRAHIEPTCVCGASVCLSSKVSFAEICGSSRRYTLWRYRSLFRRYRALLRRYRACVCEAYQAYCVSSCALRQDRHAAA